MELTAAQKQHPALMAAFAVIDRHVTESIERVRKMEPKPWRSLRDRAQTLRRLGFLTSAEIGDLTLRGRNRLLYKLERALVSERERSNLGHRFNFTFNQNRAENLRLAVRAERLAIDEMTPVLRKFEATAVELAA